MIDTDSPVREIHLNPGDLWFGSGVVRLRTVLGSCISVTLWHPVRHVGGMCHFMLPGRSRRPDEELSGKYADEAFLLFDTQILLANTRPEEYQAKIFGGGNMFPGSVVRPESDVGQRNLETARQLLAERGMLITGEHVGGAGHRRLLFDVWSGDAWLSFQDVLPIEGEE